jgi:hypothetical protein
MIIPDANVPEVLKASKLAAAKGMRVLSQSLYPRKYPADDISAEAFQFLFSYHLDPYLLGYVI